MSVLDDGGRVPDRDIVENAEQLIRPHLIETPVLRSDVLDEIAGCRLFFKAENLQTTGSFKLRGATNRLLRISETDRKRGVVAFSSGNHAQGVARAARRLDMPAVIVMPQTAPVTKIEGVRRDGAQIRLYKPDLENREALAREIAGTTGAVLVPSYDDPYIVAGQGSCGVELRRQMSALGFVPDHLVCCAGGGGLTSGIALALDGLATRIWTAEPEGHDDWARSFEAQAICTNAPGIRSICDAILTPEPGRLPWAILGPRSAGGLVVTDQQVLTAMKLAFRELKLVLEPGGAVALAAALFATPEAFKDGVVAVVLSGGNVDVDMFARALDVSFP